MPRTLLLIGLLVTAACTTASVPLDGASPDLVGTAGLDLGPAEESQVLDLAFEAGVAPDLASSADLLAVDLLPEPPAVVIPDDTVPCEHPEYWPHTLGSTLFPLLVHYRQSTELPQAEQVLALLEKSWQVEVEQLGFSAPRPDDAACGPDERFDVFLWRGHEECYVDVTGPDPGTPDDDQRSFLVVDPWGPYGGAMLPATVAHELNHACQAADDWNDAPPIYEMTSVLMEEAVCDDDNGYQQIATDFQDRPDWSLDRDDGYQTWFMYGATLYLMYLRDRHYDGHYEFAAQLWQRMRNPPGDNEPDFVDALESLLAMQGTTFADSVAEFSRWRWYTGTRADGAHLREADALPEVKLAGSYRVDKSRKIPLAPAPMLLGTSYVELVRQAGDATQVKLSLSNASSDCRWRVQAVPGLFAGSDGEVLALDSGSATIELAASDRRTIILTALPLGAYDPDERDDTRYAATLVVTPVVQ